MKLAPGDQVGPYRIVGAHPGGGYRGVSGSRRVRIHLALPRRDWRIEAVQLLRASSLLAGLDHPGIARIVDRGVIAHPEPRPWIASELADGVPLSEILARRVLAVDELLELVRDVASILRHVHGRGLLHDALQPDAIVVRTGAREFPIQLGGWSELMFAPNSVAGDIHALGVIAYRGITGRFPGIHPPELIPGVSGPVSALLVRMLAIDPARRPSAADIVGEIGVLAGDRALAGPRFARPRWTPPPPELALPAAPIVLPRKRPA